MSEPAPIPPPRGFLESLLRDLGLLTGATGGGVTAGYQLSGSTAVAATTGGLSLALTALVRITFYIRQQLALAEQSRRRESLAAEARSHARAERDAKRQKLRDQLLLRDLRNQRVILQSLDAIWTHLKMPHPGPFDLSEKTDPNAEDLEAALGLRPRMVASESDQFDTRTGDFRRVDRERERG